MSRSRPRRPEVARPPEGRRACAKPHPAARGPRKGPKVRPSGERGVGSPRPQDHRHGPARHYLAPTRVSSPPNRALPAPHRVALNQPEGFGRVQQQGSLPPEVPPAAPRPAARPARGTSITVRAGSGRGAQPSAEPSMPLLRPALSASALRLQVGAFAKQRRVRCFFLSLFHTTAAGDRSPPFCSSEQRHRCRA